MKSWAHLKPCESLGGMSKVSKNWAFYKKGGGVIQRKAGSREGEDSFNLTITTVLTRKVYIQEVFTNESQGNGSVSGAIHGYWEAQEGPKGQSPLDIKEGIK